MLGNLRRPGTGVKSEDHIINWLIRSYKASKIKGVATLSLEGGSSDILVLYIIEHQ